MSRLQTTVPTLVACFMTAALGAEMVEIQALKDNTLYETANGAVSNGAGAHIFAGQSSSGQLKRAVIAFDVASEIPEGSEIKTVRLTLHLSRTQIGDEPVTLHRALGGGWAEPAPVEPPKGNDYLPF